MRCIVDFLLHISYFSRKFALINHNPMNKNLLFSSLILLSVITSQAPANAQATVTSLNGYTVNVALAPRSVITSTNNCQHGYNYNVSLDYLVTFSGPNQPTSLYTLQGTIGCGADNHFFDLPNSQGTGITTSQSNVWRSSDDCATATISSLSCRFATIEIEGPGISHRYISFLAALPVLPVKLTSFTAITISNKVKISWATETEANSDYFEVEKSANGTEWTMVKKVKAAGYSTGIRQYEVFDAMPLNGTTYYRLKQADADGKTEYSSTRTVTYDNGGAIDVFPVPNSGNRINFSGLTEPAGMMMQVQNMSGATVYSTTLNSSSSELPQLKPGMYYIRLTNSKTGEVTSLKYMKI